MTDKTELEVTQSAQDAWDTFDPAIFHGDMTGPEAFARFERDILATSTPDPTPVAWVYECGKSRIVKENRDLGLSGYTETPLYTHPPAVPANGLVEALERIAAPAIVSLDQCPDADQPNGWRHLAVDRIDIARTALAAYRGEA